MRSRLAVTTVFRVWRRAVTPAASSTSLRIVPPWTNPIGLASLGSICDDRIDLDSLTGFEALMFRRSSGRRNLALSLRHGILPFRMEIMDLLSVRGAEFDSLGCSLDSAACCSDP